MDFFQDKTCEEEKRITQMWPLKYLRIVGSGNRIESSKLESMDTHEGLFFGGGGSDRVSV